MTETLPLPQTLIKEKHSRNFGLDLVRACAIIMVFLAHTNPINPMNPAFPWFGWFGCGVEAFFVLSGFLIGRIILRTLFDPEITMRSIWQFWVNRWLRTIPAYLFVLGLEFQFAGFVHRGFVYLFFGQNLVAPMQSFFTHSWSLAVEEWFYLLFPLSLFLIGKLTGKKYSRMQLFLIGACGFILAGFVSKCFYRLLYQQDFLQILIDRGVLLPSWKVFIGKSGNWDEMRKMVIFRIDAIAYGCLAAWLMFRYTFSRLLRLFLLLAACICLCCCIWIVDSTVASFKASFISDVFLLPLFCIAFALMLPAAESCPRPEKILNGIVGHISKVSYSFYLLHFLVITKATDYYNLNPGIPKWVIFGVTYMSIYFLSTLMYHFIELPFMEYRKKLFRKTQLMRLSVRESL